MRRAAYEFATRGLIDAPETLELKDEDGTILRSREAYAFLDDYEKAPDSVNPSLWENTKNNHAYGLFEVTDGIYRANPLDSLPERETLGKLKRKKAGIPLQAECGFCLFNDPKSTYSPLRGR